MKTLNEISSEYEVHANQVAKCLEEVSLREKAIIESGATDENLLAKAIETKRLLITRDKDFGALVFLKEELSAGVILLRVTPASVEEVHWELHRIFQEHTEEELMHHFCVVEPHRYRIRSLQ